MTDPHPAWAGRMVELEALADNPQTGDATADLLIGEAGNLLDLICETPARTLAGAREQIRHAITLVEGYGFDDRELVALKNALGTLDRLAGMEVRP